MADNAPPAATDAAAAKQSPEESMPKAVQQEKPKGTSETSAQPGTAQPSLLMTNANNRPSSVDSNASGSGAPPSASAPPVRTTTSRRGRGIRSRSPPNMRSTPPSTNDYTGGGGGAAVDVRPPAPPRSPENPSSAAAAAAAAAKAIAEGRKPAWDDAAKRGDPGRYHPGYDNNAFQGSRNWPGGEDPSGQRGFGQLAEGPGRLPPSMHMPYEQGYGGGDAQQQNRAKRRHPDHRAPYDARPEFEAANFGDMRSREPPFDRRQGEAFNQADPRRERDGRPDFYNDNAAAMPYQKGAPAPPPRGGEPQQGGEAPATVKRKGAGGTSRVIGTATPIHVPRAGEPPRVASQGSASSVFRDRPDKMAAQPAPGRTEDDTPQRILMTLRTPTTSFEESKPSRSQKSKDRGSGPPLSPEAPPKIQHAHHQQGDQPLFFDPQRSPGAGSQPQLQPSSTLEMTPSFSLFSQSFDSLGDAANYLTSGAPLDTAFQSYSFGAGPTGSGDNENGPVQRLPSPVQRDMSFGGSQRGAFNASAQQLLGGSSSGGMFTFGMSPENSFGNGPPAPPRNRGSITLLADDARAPSPTQVLGMYPSYSGGYGSQGPMQAPFRSRSGPMGDDGVPNNGSFMSQGYGRSFETGPPPGSYPGPMGAPVRSQEAMNGTLSFYPFLRRNKAAFIKCTFLLPGLKQALLESPLTDHKKPLEGGDTTGGKESNGPGSGAKKKGQPMAEVSIGRGGRGYLEPSPQDTAVASRRIVSSVCAFGGSIIGDRAGLSKDNRAGNSSIFRAKDGGMQPSHVTVTPSSSSGTPPGNRLSSRARAKYDELLPTRYYENENRLSWEFEETPPVGSVSDDEDGGDNIRGSPPKTDAEDGSGKKEGDEHRTLAASPNAEESKIEAPGDGSQKSSSPDQPKMRYRCKLCGLPKQNHTCPYQQSLQRSIGTMVYPAVNAFTSNEPGLLAPALSDMNNFIHSGSEATSSPDSSPDRPSPGRRGQRATTPRSQGAHNVTPETLRSTSQANSPGSTSISTGSGTPQRFRTPRKRKASAASPSMSGGTTISQRVVSGTSPGRSGGLRKRQHSQMSDEQSTDLLFVEAVDLKPEQFRIITTCKQRPGAYTYPALPLPYAQRKRLSDNLFALSKEVPQLTDECAVVLREAREKDMWDLAVAELMTQVVIIIHCHDGDTRFEGLRQYLLTLGIAC